MTTNDRAGLAWPPPGPGSWVLDRTHKATAMTQPWQDIFGAGMAEGFRSWTTRYGLPLSHMEVRFVHGFAYLQAIPAGVRDGGRNAPPPPPVLWALVRLNPELRRRSGAARRAVAERTWLTDARRWWEQTRPARMAANLAFQVIDLADTDDAALAGHLQQASAALRAGLIEHFGLIGATSVPVGRLLLATERWGIGPTPTLQLLRGSTPGSLEPARSLARVGALLGEAATTLSSLDDLPLGSPAAAALDEVLRLHRWRLFADADLDAPTLGELPATILALITASQALSSAREPVADVHAVSEQIPAPEQTGFETLVAEARAGHAVRDDSASVSVQWTGGLLRRALLEAGRRFADSGVLHAPEHVFELHVDESADLLAGAGGRGRVDPDDAAARAQARSLPSDPPTRLGPVHSPPAAAVFPRAMADMSGAVDAYRRLMGAEPPTDGLRGTGIGTRPHSGRAVVASDGAGAVSRITPGDVLVMASTNPCVNPALALAGAVVTEQGGLLCHTAIAAREIDLPAVVGLGQATTRIPDGAMVKVDPARGMVVVVASTDQDQPSWS